jgi:hypothetical protein
MKKDKYSNLVQRRVLKYLQESRKSIYLVALLLGATLTVVPMAAMAHPSFVYTESGFGKSVNAVNNAPNTLFVGNATLVTNGTTLFNYVGVGGNDTFNLYGGNTTSVFVATGALNNTFNVITGNPVKSTNSSTFSLMTGDNSTFNITQNNLNGSVTFAITGGMLSNLTETGAGNIAATTYSINLGFNSTVVLGSDFQGNATTVNVVF